MFVINPFLQVVSKNTTLRLKIYDPAFHFSKATSPNVSLHHNAFKEARGDVTTGVPTRSLTGVEGEWDGNDMTRPATQVGPRTVEAGLGGHDAGVSGVDEGVESASLPLSKLGRLAWSDCPTFSGFCGQVNDFRSENKTTETFFWWDVHQSGLRTVYFCNMFLNFLEHS